MENLKVKTKKGVTAPTEATPVDATSEEATPVDATSEEATPVDAASEEATPVDATSEEEAAPKEATSEAKAPVFNIETATLVGCINETEYLTNKIKNGVNLTGIEMGYFPLLATKIKELREGLAQHSINIKQGTEKLDALTQEFETAKQEFETAKQVFEIAKQALLDSFAVSKETLFNAGLDTNLMPLAVVTKTTQTGTTLTTIGTPTRGNKAKLMEHLKKLSNKDLLAFTPQDAGKLYVSYGSRDISGENSNRAKQDLETCRNFILANIK